jgi:hypothetical protein
MEVMKQLTWKQFKGRSIPKGINPDMYHVLTCLREFYDSTMHVNFIKWGKPTLQDAFSVFNIKRGVNSGKSYRQCLSETKVIANSVDWDDVVDLFESGTADLYAYSHQHGTVDELESVIGKHQYMTPVPGFFYKAMFSQRCNA